MNKENYSLLERPKGTIMYLLFADRQGYHLNLREVEYQGFKASERIDHYPGDVRTPAFDQVQETFIVSFIDKKNSQEISVTVDNVPYWRGQRAFNTDEHLTCGHAPYPYIDVYFTVSKERLKEYLTNESKLLVLLKKHITEVCESYNTIIDILNKEG